jgi:hypothetical protein
VPDIFRPARAARFAGAFGDNPSPLECVDEQARLGRFAGPFTALDGDEAAARRNGFSGPRGQCRLPQTRWAATIAARAIGPMRGTLVAA